MGLWALWSLVACDAAMDPVGAASPQGSDGAAGLQATIAGEAEAFDSLSASGSGVTWWRVDMATPDAGADPDPSHLEGASGGAYLEALPDTFVTSDDTAQPGENFWVTPGAGPTLSYDIDLPQAGKYYVWVRAFASAGGKDNTLHVGLDDVWPESGSVIQVCTRDEWTWSSNQRQSGADVCGQPRTIFLEAVKPGRHTLRFSMREDGFEFDRWLLTTDPELLPADGAK